MTRNRARVTRHRFLYRRPISVARPSAPFPTIGILVRLALRRRRSQRPPDATGALARYTRPMLPVAYGRRERAPRSASHALISSILINLVNTQVLELVDDLVIAPLDDPAEQLRDVHQRRALHWPASSPLHGLRWSGYAPLSRSRQGARGPVGVSCRARGGAGPRRFRCDRWRGLRRMSRISIDEVAAERDRLLLVTAFSGGNSARSSCVQATVRTSSKPCCTLIPGFVSFPLSRARFNHLGNGVTHGRFRHYHPRRHDR